MAKKVFAICGFKGRMGQAIQQVAHRDGLAIELLPFSKELGQADCVIDFSSEVGFHEALSWSVEHKVPFVSGTTGLGPALDQALKKAATQVPVLWAANFSVGIQWMQSLLKLARQVDQQFQFQIEEVHHQHKKDAPSGTALILQKTLADSVSQKVPPPVSIRGGGVFGIHKVWAMGQDEVITIEHQALNRTVFGHGALVAADWIIGQKPGLYEMSDVLGLDK